MGAKETGTSSVGQKVWIFRTRGASNSEIRALRSTGVRRCSPSVRCRDCRAREYSRGGKQPISCVDSRRRSSGRQRRGRLPHRHSHRGRWALPPDDRRRRVQHAPGLGRGEAQLLRAGWPCWPLGNRAMQLTQVGGGVSPVACRPAGGSQAPGRWPLPVARAGRRACRGSAKCGG